MSECIFCSGDVVRDADGHEHTFIRYIRGLGCPWCAVATMTALGYWAQFPVDELTLVRRGRVIE